MPRKTTSKSDGTVLLKAGASSRRGSLAIRGMPTPVDAAGKPTFTNEALSEQNQNRSFTEGKREAFWVATVNGSAEAIGEFMRPSAAMRR